jgi:hypothetical protein
MIRFSTKALIVAALAVLASIATAPTASADGGQLDAVHSEFTLNSFSISNNQLDTNIQLGPGALALLVGGSLGDLKTIQIVSDGVTYTFSDVRISNWGLDFWKGGAIVDFTFKGETSSATVPEPASVLLIGCGLLALAIASSRKMLRA